MASEKTKPTLKLPKTLKGGTPQDKTGQTWEQRDYNWQEMETDYIYGFTDAETGHHKFPTIEEITERHGFDKTRATIISAIRAKSSALGWRLKREEYRNQLEQARRVEMIRKMSSRQSGFDDECWKIAEAGLTNIKKHFNTWASQQLAVPAQELERLARSFQKFQLSGRLALGDTVSDLREKMDGGNIDFEKLTKAELKQLNGMLEKVGPGGD